MCAIVGVCGNGALQDRSWLKSGRDSMLHRGPDDFGEWWSEDGLVGLAHRRLSIIDLSNLGQQPMHWPERGLSIVFNGEIYNHIALRKELVGLGINFHSGSDTEVLLAAYMTWGQDCLDRINGMFAFALYDAPQHKVFLARDRAGEKPLFYFFEDGTLQFASELKALLANRANPRRIDPEAMDCYLAMGYIPGDRCILHGFKKLPPAHAMVFDLKTSQIKIWQYWHTPEFESKNTSSDDGDLLDELENLLEDAVRGQMIADVPVGILLSGGVDSSLVTAMAVRASKDVRTFTVGFPGHVKHDETRHARLVAQFFGTNHTELMSEKVTTDLLTRLARQFDEPIADSSMIPTFLVSQLVRQYCTVALGGDGGDELFGGYGHYSRLQVMQKNLALMPFSLRKLIALSAEKTLPVGLKGRNFLQGLDVDLSNGLPVIATYFDITTRRNLLRAYKDWPFVAEIIRKDRVPNSSDIVQRATRMDFSNYLAEDILVKVDRASMLSSLEMRAPLLDKRLIEFAFSRVPSRLKATPREKKILLKRLTDRILPPEFDRQRKQGFSIPLGEWLKGSSFSKMFNDVLRDPGCSFDVKTIDELMRGQSIGRSNSERLFSLVMFELWRQEYRITF